MLRSRRATVLVIVVATCALGLHLAAHWLPTHSVHATKDSTLSVGVPSRSLLVTTPLGQHQIRDRCCTSTTTAATIGNVTVGASLLANAIRARFDPGAWAWGGSAGTGNRHVISIDESGNRYYESRDLRAWRLVVGAHGYTVHENWPRPFLVDTLKDHPQVTLLLCMTMVATESRCIQPALLKTLPPYFRVNQIPGLRQVLWRKDSYCRTTAGVIHDATAALGRSAAAGLQQHVIRCWVYPDHAAELRAYFETGGAMVIVKPATRGEGRGIYTARTFTEIATEANDPVAQRTHGATRVVQKMELSPALLRGRKFDLRCYVLVTSIQPLRMYMWDEGLVRLAAVRYNASSIKGTANRESWMTNTFVNKAFADVHDLTLSFKALNERLRQTGVGVRRIWRGIHDAIVHSFLLSEREMAQYIYTELGGKPCVQCFQLLGVDVLLDADYSASVIEVNGLPSLQLSNGKDDVVDTSMQYTRMKLEMLSNAVDLLTRNCSLPTGPPGEHVLRAAAALTMNGHSVNSELLQYLASGMCETIHATGFTRIFPTAQHVGLPAHMAAFLNWSAAEVRGLFSGRPSIVTNADVVRDVLPALEVVASFRRQQRTA